MKLALLLFWLFAGYASAQLIPPTSMIQQPAEPSCYNGLCIPDKTWIARKLPDRGIGPCTLGTSGGCKEVRGTIDANGRVYLFAGDYTGRAPSGYWGSLFSYFIPDNSWKTEYPNVGIPGDTYMQNIADEVAWVYDSKRKLHFWLGGFGGSCCYGDPIGTLSNGVEKLDPPISFDSATRKWAKTTLPRLPGQHAVYDPLTDTILQLTDNGLIILHPDGTQELVWIPNELNLGMLQRNNIYDIDANGRALYYINLGNFWQSVPDRITNLVRYNIDLRTFDNLGPTPIQDNLYYPLSAFDSVNKVFMWVTTWDWPQSRVFLYHPDSKSWEEDQLIQPEGQRPTGNFLIFDSPHNAFMLMGCGDACMDYGAVNNSGQFLYLYRYNNPKGN